MICMVIDTCYIILYFSEVKININKLITTAYPLYLVPFYVGTVSKLVVSICV